MKKTAYSRFVAVCTGLLLLASCASGGDSQSTADHGGAPAAERAVPADTNHSAALGEAATDGGLENTAPQARQEQKLIQTGSARVRVDDPEAGLAAVRTKIQELGGRLDNIGTSTTDGHVSATMTLRIPSDKFDGFLQYLDDLGKVESTNVSVSDVTLEYRDTEARIKTLEASIAGLRELLEKSASVEELLAVETQLTSHQSELDGLKAQLRVLEDQVSLSTLDLELRTSFTYESPDDSFSSAFREGWQNLVNFAKALVRMLPLLLVWVLAIGAAYWLARGLGRRYQRRRATAAGTLDAASATPARQSDPDDSLPTAPPAGTPLAPLDQVTAPPPAID